MSTRDWSLDLHEVAGAAVNGSLKQSVLAQRCVRSEGGSFSAFEACCQLEISKCYNFRLLNWFCCKCILVKITE